MTGCSSLPVNSSRVNLNTCTMKYLSLIAKKLDLLLIMMATFKSEITRDLDLDISAVWDRISQPTEDDTGNLPEPDDYRLLLGLSYSF